MQQLKTEITIQIPKTHVLVERTEFEALQEQANETWVKGLDWLRQQTGIGSSVTLRENLLYKYRDELEPFVTYPQNQGQSWYFNVVPMKQWLKENFKKVAKA